MPPGISSSSCLQSATCILSGSLASLRIQSSISSSLRPLQRNLDSSHRSLQIKNVSSNLPYLYPRWCLTNGTASLHTASILYARKQKKPPSNPWSVAKAAEKRDKVKARRKELERLRQEAASDPVVGHNTPFLEGMDAKPATLPPIDHLVRAVDKDTRQAQFEEAVTEERIGRLNHYLQVEEVKAVIERSRDLEEKPVSKATERDIRRAKEMHLKATAAMNRILSLGNGSSKDRTRANKAWCIETFGRHVTDEKSRPEKHVSLSANPATDPTKTPRVGPDVGSSEVQAAILTMKIRSLAKHLETNTHDKMNKRNLRLMVHKRQKLLKYLKKKEQGGERYRYVMASLGLDDDAIMKEVFM